MIIDDIDVKILEALQENARISIRELAKKINLSPPSVAERVRKMEDSGVIEGYTIRINHKELGLMIDCILEVTMKNGEYDRFKQWIAKHPRAVFCYRIAGQACFLVKLSVRTIDEIEAFINEAAAFARTATHIVFSEVKVVQDVAKFLE
jgi:Lrp/AsnC family transcriptional regulator, leucine-responsive regulatory protein